MIIKFGKKPGGSFSGLTVYLMHDAGHATTSARVAWTHTLNLAHDHVPSAVHEMYRTWFDADLLKEEAGVHAGGSAVEKPVKHISLSWHPSEKPERAEMMRAAQSFLEHMGWSEHQAVLVAHNDKAYEHVHLVVNAIHPETGRKLDDGFERRRAQAWALGYEQQMGHVFCEERLKPVAEREQAEPRPAWMATREAIENELLGEQARLGYDSSYMSRADVRQDIERNEWQILKELQKQERIAFMAEGKQAYTELNREIYRGVREEFRPEWASYYTAKRDGLSFETLGEIRAGLIAQQKEVLEERREAAFAELRAERDQEYRVLLDAQREQRGELVAWQEQGISWHQLLGRRYPFQQESEEASDAREAGSVFDAADTSRAGQPPAKREHFQDSADALSVEEAMFTRTGDLSPSPPSRDVASGLAGGLLAFLGSLGESVSGGHTAPPHRTAQIDPLARYGVLRSHGPPDDPIEKARREADAREDWYAWKEKRDRSGSGW